MHGPPFCWFSSENQSVYENTLGRCCSPSSPIAVFISSTRQFLSLPILFNGNSFSWSCDSFSFHCAAVSGDCEKQTVIHEFHTHPTEY